MSRVYEALCESQRERGLPVEFLDARVLAPELLPVKHATDLAWDKVSSFRVPTTPEARLVALDGGSTLGAEKFRLLRARLRHLQDRKQIKRVVVTSAAPEEGKTLVAGNLAISLAKHSSQKILLLEGDLHKRALAGRMGLLGCKGIGEWFSAEEEPLHRFVYHADDLQLWVLPAGVVRLHPLAILQSQRFQEFFQQLGNVFDWIIIDAPPLSPLADVSFWSRVADGLLLVVREGKTSRSLLQKGLETLDNPRVLGVVMNDSHAPGRNYYDNYYAPHAHSPAL